MPGRSLARASSCVCFYGRPGGTWFEVSRGSCTYGDGRRLITDINFVTAHSAVFRFRTIKAKAKDEFIRRKIRVTLSLRERKYDRRRRAARPRGAQYFTVLCNTTPEPQLTNPPASSELAIRSVNEAGPAQDVPCESASPRAHGSNRSFLLAASSLSAGRCAQLDISRNMRAMGKSAARSCCCFSSPPRTTWPSKGPRVGSRG